MRMIKFLLVILILITNQNIKGAELILTGKVRDINTHNEIPGVNIFIKNTSTGTASDFAGRFTLKIARADLQLFITFQHIGYYAKDIRLDSLKTMRNIYLQPRVIPFKGLEIEAAGTNLEIKKDLPQAITLMGAENFEIRGFVDAGDFLRSEHSVQVDEAVSGKKTLAIRGGNPDEVMVLYNGIKMNSVYDNIFDLSLVELEDIERLEIIKGSNTTLFGAGAFAGVVNIVPKMKQDYHVRFQQRVGTYRSGNWGINFYQPINRLHASYSYKNGATRRIFAESDAEDDFMVNRSAHHSASLIYDFSDNTTQSSKNTLAAMFIKSDLNYENERDQETIDQLNQIASLKYEGDIFWLKNLNLSGAVRQLDEDQALAVNPLKHALKENRKILNDSYFINAEKIISLKLMHLLLGYQFEDAKLKFRDDYIKTSWKNAQLNRQQHGFVAITKLHAPSGSPIIPFFDLDVSLRHDRVHDEKNNRPFDNTSGFSSGITELSEKKDWNTTSVKFSANLNGSHEDLSFNSYLNYGKNIKFPTLLQQISQPYASSQLTAQPDLNPEKNSSMEFGIELTRNIKGNPTFSGWMLSGNYFKNYYENKFRMFYFPGTPVAYYDNVKDAQIGGLEVKGSIFSLQKKVTVDLGLSKYAISEPAAFPFKSDFKFTSDLKIDHAGYAFQLHFFNESEQTAWVRRSLEDFDEVTLPGYSDIDVHLTKTFEIYKFKLMLNASVRNLLNDEVELVGLALRDRRYYLTMGIQY